MRRKAKKRTSIGSIILGIILLFSISSIAGFKIAEKTDTKVNIIAASTGESSGNNIQLQQVSNNTNSETDINENKQDEATQNKLEATNIKENKGQVVTPDGTKVAYLTFDDGPTPYITSNILDILKENHIKATFFVIGKMAERNPDLLKREKSEGHTVANHTYSHNYKYIYSSTDNFLQELKVADEVITSIIGEHNKTLIRFPGGSFGRQAYKQAVESSGYHYVDWNCLNGDAEVATASVDRLISRFKETTQDQKELIILMHDAPGKTTTVQALPEIIKYLKANGYLFKTLN
ncbi:polysaccharide deacetylase family protein [Clostridium magnum]|uniref:Peptidoglycan-N-acetylglucosamine deacetylase n=1 Tax=Clostridium magnum DSM 2767 TaxID=1121326 RepID=A0A162RFU5_9CLOT|nr:polysaccharide deacetylase family protein [Clostridium magnum]KZL89841.1 peptidoglycan-N-acetylglucosamine deacetylase [Clostridium magnum DSM 2767]SHI70365.1 Peptidoglycan/xylan/chitin deacetylase, PgdA/CDA1 family [Clostridium magnum DSM 2767]